MTFNDTRERIGLGAEGRGLRDWERIKAREREERHTGKRPC